jgi:uncharacterized spore protein YtfJ
MEPADIIERAQGAMAVDRVFGKPIERDGMTIVPVANVRGGAGGGTGEKEAQRGSGGGFGLLAKPSGVYVIKGESVRWRPAIDVNRIILGGQIVMIFVTLAIRAFADRRR